MRELVVKYLNKKMSRRGFRQRPDQGRHHHDRRAGRAGLGELGQPGADRPPPAAAGAAAARGRRRTAGQAGAGVVKAVQGTGGAAFAEQLIASGVKYVFGNSASEDAPVLRGARRSPAAQIHPHAARRARRRDGGRLHQGLGRARDRDAGRGGRHGQCHRPDVQRLQGADAAGGLLLPHRPDRRAGRDGFEEVANQEQIVQPITKYTWLARRADMIPETVRRAFKASWTPPYGPSYISWHSDYNDERVRTEIIAQDQFDPRMRVRPNPQEVERAAKLLVEAKMPLMIVGDEIYKAKAVAKAVKLAELLGMPVTQARQIYANFPEAHPLWVGNLPAGTLELDHLAEGLRRRHQRRQQAPAQQPGADRPAQHEVHRHADRPLEHGQRHAHRGAAGRRRRLRPRRPDRRGRAADHARAQAEVRRARRRGEEVHHAGARAARRHRQQPGLGPGADHRRPPDLGGRAVRRSGRHHRARGRLGRRCTASTSIRSAGASCSSTTARISAPASAPRRA